MSNKKRKVRADFRKNREARARDKRGARYLDEDAPSADAPLVERVSGKGHISRRRTIAGGEIVEDDAGTKVLPVPRITLASVMTGRARDKRRQPGARSGRGDGPTPGTAYPG